MYIHVYMKLTCIAQYRVRNVEHRENEIIVLHVLMKGTKVLTLGAGR